MSARREQEGWAAGSGVAEAAAARAGQTKRGSPQRATPHGLAFSMPCGLDKPRGGGTHPGSTPLVNTPRLAVGRQASSITSSSRSNSL
jgi:hypothetical protein